MSVAAGRRVLVTGGGAVGPFGAGLPALLAGLASGRSPHAPWPCPPPSGAGRARRNSVVARAPEEIDPPPGRAAGWRRLDRCTRMAVVAAREALGSVGGAALVAADPSTPPPIGTVIGTMTAGVESLSAYLATLLAEGACAASPLLFPSTVQNAPAAQCSILLGLGGPNVTLCQMEASGLAAVAAGFDLVRSGAAEVVLAGGVDEIAADVLEAWRRLRLTRRAGDGARGFVAGEGAYLLRLESAEHAAVRGAAGWAEVLSAALAHAPGEAYRWPEDAGMAAEVIAGALSEASVAPADLSRVIGPANGVPAVGAIETGALARVLGPARAAEIPRASPKETLGESGAGSAASALLAAAWLREGKESTILVNAVGTGGALASIVARRMEGR